MIITQQVKKLPDFRDPTQIPLNKFNPELAETIPYIRSCLAKTDIHTELQNK
jgi:hypothetical protein